MTLKLVLNFTRSDVPNHGEIVIAAWSQATRIVLKPTDLSSMTLKLGNDIMRRPDIMADNLGIPRPSVQ